MADIIAHPRAQSERVIQTRNARGRYPKTVTYLADFRSKRRYAAYKALLLQEEIQKTVLAAYEWESVAASLRIKAATLQQQSQGVHRV